jgi:amino acid transporter
VRLVTEAIGPAAGVAIGLGIVASVLGAASGNVLAKPRVAFAMARDGLTFPLLGRSHPRYRTPYVSILVQGAVAILLVLTLRDFDKLTTYFVVVEWFALVFAVGAVFVLRRKLPDAPRPFKTPLYPVMPALFIMGTLLGLGTIVWGEWGSGNRSPVYGLLLAASGFPIYAIFKKRFRTHPVTDPQSAP